VQKDYVVAGRLEPYAPLDEADIDLIVRELERRGSHLAVVARLQKRARGRAVKNAGADKTLMVREFRGALHRCRGESPHVVLDVALDADCLGDVPFGTHVASRLQGA